MGDTVSKIGGIGLEALTRDILSAHSEAFDEDFDTTAPLPHIGQ